MIETGVLHCLSAPRGAVPTGVSIGKNCIDEAVGASVKEGTGVLRREPLDGNSLG